MVEFAGAFPHLSGFISWSKQNLWEETEIGKFLDVKNLHPCSPGSREFSGAQLACGFCIMLPFSSKRNYKGAEKPCAQRWTEHVLQPFKLSTASSQGMKDFRQELQYMQHWLAVCFLIWDFYSLFFKFSYWK